MDVTEKNIPEQAAVGMMDDMMVCHDPCQLLQMVMQTEKSEVQLYRDIARCIQSPCLRETIMSLIEMEQNHSKVYSQLAMAFGCVGKPCPAPPGMPPYYYAAGEKKAK